MSLCAALASFLYLCFGVTSLFLEDHASYGVPMACFIAASAFSKLIFNWIGAVRMREEHRGIIHQIKLLNVVDGLVAIALTQRALLNLEATPNVSFYCGLGEIVFGIAALLVSLLMVRRARGGEKKFIKS